MKRAEPPTADLETLFRDCGQDLSAYFARRHGRPDVTADLVQESFLHLARRLRARPAIRSPRAYLFGIARHVSLAFLRQQGNRANSLNAAPEQVISAEPDARLAAAREVIASLPDLQREILDLRFAHELSYAEIAGALNIPVGTVRSRLHHAIALLRQRLEADEMSGGRPDNPSAKAANPPEHET